MTQVSPRILMTGAGGFVGRHLLPAIRQAFAGSVVLAAGREGPVPGTDAFLPFDLARPEGLSDLVAEARPDAVLHLAAQADVAAGFRDPMGTWRANLIGTVSLAEAVLRVAPDATFILASSAEVYGLSFNAGRLDETAPLTPANPYGASKAAADLALGEMSLRGLRSIRIRAFTHTGPGQTPAFVVPAFARQVARIEAGRQESVVRTGALDRWRDFLDVRDVCSAYVAALRHAPDLAGRAINVCSGTPRRIGDVLNALLALAGVSARIEQEATRLRSTDVLRVEGDPSQAAAVLGWSPSVAWEETLRTVLADWRDRIADEA